MNDHTLPRRLSGTSSSSVPSQTGLRQKRDSRGKKYVPHVVQRVPRSAGAVGSMVNHPSTAGACVLAGLIGEV